MGDVKKLPGVSKRLKPASGGKQLSPPASCCVHVTPQATSSTLDPRPTASHPVAPATPRRSNPLAPLDDGAAIVIARQTIGGWLSIAIALVALALLLQKRLPAPEPAVVALAALAGIILHD